MTLFNDPNSVAIVNAMFIALAVPRFARKLATLKQGTQTGPLLTTDLMLALKSIECKISLVIQLVVTVFAPISCSNSLFSWESFL